jgi:Asp-tRNA(Asn)/Glu-tRNA(Gln) amidotransferase A subunit family amidase
VTPVRADEARARISELSRLHAFITVTDERGDGLTVAVKDIIDVRGVITTGGGRVLPPVPAVADAPVVAALRSRGCVIVGKTNLHEFAFGVTSENPHYGNVLNPSDESRVAGGSSGGSAVAVATRMCDLAIGTDTGGSIRIPASLCGVTGIKPTLGSVSTEGVIPLSPSLDTVGPLATDVVSAARGLEMMGGLTGLVPAAEELPEAFRLAVPAGWVGGLDGQTAAAWAGVSAGLPEISYPPRRRLWELANLVLIAEAAAYHRAWQESSPERYGADVLGRIRLGLDVTAVDYLAAQDELARLREEADRALDGWDALVVPATSVIAPRVGEADALREALSCFTRPFNATGQPAVCLPAPVSGLPVGVQVVSRRGEDALAIRVAAALERSWRAASMIQAG